MFCPKCKAEFIDGIFECGECNVSLVKALPPDHDHHVNSELVDIAIYPHRYEADHAKDLLSAKNINAFIKGSFGNNGGSPLATEYGVKLSVKTEDAEAAKSILGRPVINNNEIESRGNKKFVFYIVFEAFIILVFLVALLAGSHIGGTFLLVWFLLVFVFFVYLAYLMINKRKKAAGNHP